MVVDEESLPLVLLNIVAVQIHIPDLVQRDQVTVEGAQGKVVESLLVVGLHVSAVIIAV